jgi:hypothetical protein
VIVLLMLWTAVSLLGLALSSWLAEAWSEDSGA